jgi:hypothetical protein
LSVQTHIVDLRHELNEIGASRADIHQRLFDSHIEAHTANDSTPILATHLFSLCDSHPIRFVLAMGASLYDWNDLKMVKSMSDDQIRNFKDDILKKAYSHFNFKSVDRFPVSFSDIHKFMRDNEKSALICLYEHHNCGY